MVPKEILFHAYLKGGTIIFLLIDKIRNNCWEDIFLSFEPLQEVNEKKIKMYCELEVVNCVFVIVNDFSPVMVRAIWAVDRK